MGLSFDQMYYKALKASAKKVIKRSRHASPGLPGIAHRIPGSERKALMITARHKASRYKRDDETHVVRGASGHSLVYRFSKLPEQNDYDGDKLDESYLRKNGISVSQIDPLAGHGFPSHQRYSVQTIALHFEDLLSERIKKQIKEGGYSPRSSEIVRTEEDLVFASGDALINIGLALISYGAISRESTTATKDEAIEIAEDTARWI